METQAKTGENIESGKKMEDNEVISRLSSRQDGSLSEKKRSMR